ncbi:MAG: hypothetical protein V6Z81_11135 [Parvularculales bacterium]
MSKLLQREDAVHVSIRKHLKKNGWILIAGEYPNGSDDELHSLKVMDSLFSKDHNLDHRRHSFNKLIPDLIAYKEGIFLIIEIKTRYNKQDEEKLKILFSSRIQDLRKCLKDFLKRYMPEQNIDVFTSQLIPTMGFSKGDFQLESGFVYLKVDSLDSIDIIWNA